MVRPLCWQWPDGGFEPVTDQFMLGDDLMVAPVVQPGARSRRVVFPPGEWRADDGSVVVGPATKDIDVPLDRRSSLYVWWGDWFAAMCLVACCLVVLSELVTRLRRRNAHAVATPA